MPDLRTEAAAKALQREVHIYDPPDSPAFAKARQHRYREIAERMLAAADRAEQRERQGRLFERAADES